uniref:Putative secreted protein n=1 Tax=Panstrongylus lignarius TaxID=156445 RepID=A0A224Y3R3_9HEMI
MMPPIALLLIMQWTADGRHGLFGQPVNKRSPAVTLANHPICVYVHIVLVIIQHRRTVEHLVPDQLPVSPIARYMAAGLLGPVGLHVHRRAVLL